MTLAWKYRALFFGAACLAFGCDNQPTRNAPATDVTNWLWLSSEADALVKCSVAARCGDGAAFFGALSYLSAGGGELEHARSHLRFAMPKFAGGWRLAARAEHGALLVRHSASKLGQGLEAVCEAI